VSSLSFIFTLSSVSVSTAGRLLALWPRAWLRTCHTVVCHSLITLDLSSIRISWLPCERVAEIWSSDIAYENQDVHKRFLTNFRWINPSQATVVYTENSWHVTDSRHSEAAYWTARKVSRINKVSHVLWYTIHSRLYSYLNIFVYDFLYVVTKGKCVEPSDFGGNSVPTEN
jgi:hypothetical protein